MEINEETIDGLLNGAVDYLNRVILLKDSISNHLVKDEYDKAWNKFDDMINGLDTLNQLLTNIKNLYSLDYDNIYCKGRTINDRIGDFNEFLNKIIDGMEAKDYFQIADLIEFEFEDHLESYKDIFICIKELKDNIN